MNKYICLAIGTQMWISSLSIALHTIDKTPKEGINYYKIKYNLGEKEGLYIESGLLQGIITKDEEKKDQFKIYYTYHNYKAEINSNITDLDKVHGYINVDSVVTVGSNFQIIDIENWHPTVFFLNNLRAGLITSFNKQGDSVNTELKDNCHIYQTTCNSTIKYSDLRNLNVEYKVQNIKNVTQHQNYTHVPTYTFNWQALSYFKKYSKRKGQIEVDNMGKINFLTIYTPKIISLFYIATQTTDQPGWLNLTNISQEEFKKICLKNSIINKYFDTYKNNFYFTDESNRLTKKIFFLSEAAESPKQTSLPTEEEDIKVLPLSFSEEDFIQENLSPNLPIEKSKSIWDTLREFASGIIKAEEASPYNWDN